MVCEHTDTDGHYVCAKRARWWDRWRGRPVCGEHRTTECERLARAFQSNGNIFESDDS